MIKFHTTKPVNYWNFGFIPTGDPKKDFTGKIFGYPNLYKRLQVPDVFKSMDLKNTDEVLDFGCGLGFMTVELARKCKKAVGIDINETIKNIKVPKELHGKLEYKVARGESLPFEDNSFNVVLASEVLPMISDPKAFLNEIRRVLKPGGRIVISNSCGHPVLKSIFESKGLPYKLLKKYFGENLPNSYDEYCSILQESFGTSQKKFFEEHEIKDLLINCKYQIEQIDYSPGFLAGSYFSLSQFFMFLKSRKTLSQKNFPIKFVVLSLINAIDFKKHHGGLICVATKR